MADENALNRDLNSRTRGLTDDPANTQDRMGTGTQKSAQERPSSSETREEIESIIENKLMGDWNSPGNDSKIREKINEAWEKSFKKNGLASEKERIDLPIQYLQEVASWIFWDEKEKKIEFSNFIEQGTGEGRKTDEMFVPIEKMTEALLRDLNNKEKKWLLIGCLHTHPSRYGYFEIEGEEPGYRIASPYDKNIIINLIRDGFLEDGDERLRFIRRIGKGYLGVWKKNLEGVEFLPFEIAANESERAKKPDMVYRGEKEDGDIPEDWK
jgi:hypothetical protein